MRAFHRDFFPIVTALNLIAGVWGLVLLRRGRRITRNFFVAVLAGQAALAIQVVVGVVMFQTVKPANSMHAFYGFVLLIAAVLSHAFRGEKPRRALWVYTLIELFIGIVSVRGAMTGFG